MGLIYSSYYGLARVSDMSPSTKGWAVTDTNFELISLLLNSLGQHKHTGSTPIAAPGYNLATPTNWALATPTATPIRGYIAPGTSVGVALSFTDKNGLETVAAPEVATRASSVTDRPSPPVLGDAISTPVALALAGGTYVYALTTVGGGGETQTSNIQTITVPYSNTAESYTVEVGGLTPYTLYTATPSVTAVRIYRATGFNNPFQLVKTLTTPVYSYTDTGTLEASGTQPPITSTYGTNNSIVIDWSSISVPLEASYLNVYVTQQSSVWNTNSLLTRYDLSTPYVKSLTYLGNEVLSFGYPKNYSQIPSPPAKIDLTTEATGAPVYTTSADAKGFQTRNFVVAQGLANSTPVGGAMYFDSSTSAFKFYTGAAWNTLSTPGAFAHGANEGGGHSAANIYYPAPGGTNIKAVLDILATPVGNKSGGGVVRKSIPFTATPLADRLITHATPTDITTATVTDDTRINPTTITPDYPGQVWEFTWAGTVTDSNTWANAATTAGYGGASDSQVTVYNLNCVVGFRIDGTYLAQTARRVQLKSFVGVSAQNRDVSNGIVTFSTPLSTPIGALQLRTTVGGVVRFALDGRSQTTISGVNRVSLRNQNASFKGNI